MLSRVYILHREIVLPRPRPEVFAFFADANNLERITPTELRFEIVAPPPREMEAGTRIDYRLRLFGLAFRWKTLISDWDPPNEFTDIQLAGPYRRWEHTHGFREEGNGTRVMDRVVYELPLYPLSIPALPLVRWQLRRIFDFRESVLRQIFEPISTR